MIEAPRFELPDRDAEMVSQTESYPGFAGVYREDGELVVALEGTAGLSTAAQEDLIGTLAEMSGADLAVENVAIRTGFTYTFAELHEWHRLLSDEFLALDGAAYTDLSESTNAVVLAGDEPASLAQSMEAAIREHAIPRSAVSFIEAEPEELASLRNRWRPVRGGLEVQTPGSGNCTLAFNVIRGGLDGFVTASHCSSVWGANDLGDLHQPNLVENDTISVLGDIDPGYTSTIPGCPAGRFCRYSDATYYMERAGVTATLGAIARPNSQGDFSDYTGLNFTITAVHPFPFVGDPAEKVGRTTGWTVGQVTETCLILNVADSNRTHVCSDRASFNVTGGDSGAPVFARLPGNNVTLMGVVWGQGGAFSALLNIAEELGAMQVG